MSSRGRWRDTGRPRLGMRSLNCMARRCLAAHVRPTGTLRVALMVALWVALSVAGSLGLAACAHRPPERAPVDNLGPALERLVRDTAAAEPRAPAVWLHIQAPRLPLRWQGAAGPAANPAAQPAPSLHIASNTKTFVTAKEASRAPRRSRPQSVPDGDQQRSQRGHAEPGAALARSARR